MSKYSVEDFEVGVACFSVGDRIIASGNRLGIVSDITKKITVTWENGLSGEYTPKQMQAWNYKKFLEDEKEATECNLHNLTSAQELVQDSALQDCNMGLNSSEPQRLTNTAQASSNCDIPAYTTTETCEISQDLLNKDLDTICTPIESISSQLPHPAPRSLQKANGLEAQMSEIVSPPSSKPLENYSQGLQPLKMSQDLSPAPITQDSPQAHISEAWSIPLTFSGTMRNGLLSEAAILPAPTLESEYCWLRSPGALSLSGKGRPPGQTKQEAELKKLGLINKGEVLNPAILCQWYEIPDSWLDPSECRAATELLEECDRQQEIFSILESQRSPLTESSTSTPCVESQPPVTRANAKPGTYIIHQSQSLAIIKDNLGFGFVVNYLGFGKVPPGKVITYNWERDDQLICGLAIAPQHLIDKFLEDNQPQLCTKCFQVVAKSYICEKCSPIECTQQSNSEKRGLVGFQQRAIFQDNVSCPSCELPLIKLDDGCGVCGWTPENFLEESKEGVGLKQSSKRRQRKGCLYKYIENKKLKNGTIASYPRVIGHRQPDNPTHWRWGFNWEEKVDGEWKGRSIGSVPLGAIALIQSMQNEGVSLEEIIGFIKRAKSRKS
jgi:hypothetical protein